MDRYGWQTTRLGTPSPGPMRPLNGLVRIVLTLVIIELTVATAYVHLSLGGLLFTLNGLGYLALLAAYAVSALVPLPIVQRFGWLARVALAGYALLTIGAYLAIGPYFALGWITKGIEVAIVGLLAVDLLTAYFPPRANTHAAPGQR